MNKQIPYSNPDKRNRNKKAKERREKYQKIIDTFPIKDFAAQSSFDLKDFDLDNIMPKIAISTNYTYPVYVAVLCGYDNHFQIGLRQDFIRNKVPIKHDKTRPNKITIDDMFIFILIRDIQDIRAVNWHYWISYADAPVKDFSEKVHHLERRGAKHNSDVLPNILKYYNKGNVS